MLKCTATDVGTQPTMMQQRLTCALKNARLLSDGCCCLIDKGNKILFRINISLPLKTIAGTDGVCQWLSLPGHQTSHHWTSSYGATLKLWFTCCQLILKKILLPVLLRQQQTSDNNLAFSSAHISLCCIVVGSVSRLMAVHLNICCNLVW